MRRRKLAARGVAPPADFVAVGATAGGASGFADGKTGNGGVSGSGAGGWSEVAKRVPSGGHHGKEEGGGGSAFKVVAAKKKGKR